MKKIIIVINILLTMLLVGCTKGTNSGEAKSNKRNGQGTITYDNGSKYIGEFKDGKENGQGTIHFPNGNKFIGEFKDGKNWNGTFYDKDGNIFQKYVNGKPLNQQDY